MIVAMIDISIFFTSGPPSVVWHTRASHNHEMFCDILRNELILELQSSKSTELEEVISRAQSRFSAHPARYHSTELMSTTMRITESDIADEDAFVINIPHPESCENGYWLLSDLPKRTIKHYAKASNETLAEFANFIDSNNLMFGAGYDAAGVDSVTAVVAGGSPHDVLMQLRGSFLHSVVIRGPLRDLLSGINQPIVDLLTSIPRDKVGLAKDFSW